ncbi:MAG: hypothetical protein P8X79_19155 [Reinekea sp.]
MSTAIEYLITEHISSELSQQISDCIAEMSDPYEWYIEPITLLETSRSLRGTSKLFRFFDDDGEALSLKQETEKVLYDLEYLFAVLESAAQQFSVQWALNIEGVPVGHITSTGMDDQLMKTSSDFLSRLASFFCVTSFIADKF